MAGEPVHKGSCFCGEVPFEVPGTPAAMGHCHCESCRHWSAGPVNAFTLWKPEAFKLTHGTASIGTYNKTPVSFSQTVQAVRRPYVHRPSDQMKDMPNEMGGSGVVVPD